MNKLIRANFARLKRSKCFWICMTAMIAYGLIFCVGKYQDKVHGYMVSFDAVFFGPYIMVGILIAVFCSIFIGTEYSDGTIRNKLVVGHSRISIYLTNFIVSAAAGLLMNMVYLAIVCAVGIPLLGFLNTALPAVLLLLLDGILLTVAFAAIFSLLAMLNQNKALVAVISTVSIFAVLVLAAYIYGRIEEPEFLQPYSVTSITTDSGEQTVVQSGSGELVPNPRYLNESQRAVFQFFLDVLPSGQALELTSMNAPNLGRMPLYSAVIIVAANAAGVFFFRRKDLR